MDPKQPERPTLTGDESVLFVAGARSDVPGGGKPLGERHMMLAMSATEALEMTPWECVGVGIIHENLPDMAGRELLRRLRHDHPDVRRILLVAGPDPNVAADVLENGDAHAVLTATDDVDQVLRTIESLAENQGPVTRYESRHGRTMPFNRLDDHQSIWQALISAERMADVGLLAAAVAHEVNNLIGGVRGFAQLAQMSGSLEDHERVVDVVFETSERAKTLAGDLLTIATRDPERQETASLAGVVQQVATLLQRSLRKQNIEINVDIHDRWMVHTQLGKFQQVLLHVMLSATSGMPRGGTLAIQSCHAEDGGITISLRDDGALFTEEEQQALFEPHAAALAPEGRLSGAGLAVCHEVMRQLGGSISGGNQPDGGVEMLLTLPKTARVGY